MSVASPPVVVTNLVTTGWMLQKACAKLAGRALLVLDLEGERLGRDGTLSMLQIAVSPQEVYCFDILALGAKALDKAHLRPVLEDPQVVKLCYDGRSDADALYHIYGVVLRGLYDIQVLYTCLFQAPTDPYLKGLTHALRMPGVVDKGLLELIVECKETCKKQLSSSTTQDHLFMTRPLCSMALRYCILDVIYLFDMYAGWSSRCDGERVARITRERTEAFVHMSADARSALGPRAFSRVDFDFSAPPP